MTPLAPSAIHARKRPVAVASMFVAELAWALVVATPVHEWVRRAWGAHPDGDAVLFARGGRDLLVWLGQEDAAMSVTARTTLALLVVGTLLLQVPFGALVASLAFDREIAAPPAGEATAPSRATRALPMATAWKIGIASWLPLATLLAFSVLVSVIVLSLGGILAALVESGLTASLGDARSFTLRVVFFALFEAIAAVVGVVVDLARAAVVREIGIAHTAGTSAAGWRTMLRALGTALATARMSLGRASLDWTGRCVIGIALIAIGFVAANALGGRGGAALGGLFVIHQAVVLGRVALRASWMARALALVAPVQDAREAKRSSAT